MSGFVVVVNFDASPIDQPLLERMLSTLTFRGPDSQSIYITEKAGFAHSMFRETFDTESEQQPFMLEGLTIVANARIDERNTLIEKLQSAGRNISRNAPDVELILSAYLVWAEDSVRHLIGDFAFAIWDTTRQQLFAARDHFGLRGLFYAHKGNTLIVSNDISAIRLHPLVSSALDERAIGDFLLFGSHLWLEKSRTAYADIQRIPPAHALICNPQQSRIERYWTLPITPMLRYRDRSSYIEHFREVFKDAVKDR